MTKSLEGVKVLPEKCPFCGAKVRLNSSQLIYEKDYGLIWLCQNFPECDSYVGCHKGTTKPKGTLANRELREWRKKAHSKFDPLWQSGNMTRKDAYNFLQLKMNIPVDKCHIAMFDIEQCKKLLTVI